MFDINGGEFLVIAMLALLVLGPDRLPDLARQLAGLLRRARQFASGAREQMRDELGPEFDEVDWRRYDIRQYHPRRIVQNALSDITEDDSERPATRRRSTGRSGGPSGTGAVGGDRRDRTAAASGRQLRTGAARRGDGPASSRASRTHVGDATPLPPSPPPTSWAAAADRSGTDDVT